jgi:hypothetical protein
MYLEDECVPSSSGDNARSVTPEPPGSFTPIVPSPMASPETSPRSSPKPTRPSPLPPRRRSDSTDSKATDASKPNDAMMRSILSSPLGGNPSPAFSESSENLDTSFMSPTVLRRPPPRALGSGGSTTMDKYVSFFYIISFHSCAGKKQTNKTKYKEIIPIVKSSCYLSNKADVHGLGTIHLGHYFFSSKFNFQQQTSFAFLHIV